MPLRVLDTIRNWIAIKRGQSSPLRLLAQALFHIFRLGGIPPQVTEFRSKFHLQQSSFQITLNQSGSISAIKCYWGGVNSYEPFTAQVVWVIMSSGGALVDIGANTGLYSALALSASDSSTAFSVEPLPENCESIRDLLGRFASRWSLCEGAVTHVEHETTTLYIPARDRYSNPSGGTIIEQADIDQSDAFRTSVKVRNVADQTLDFLHEGDVRLVKIDVERHELVVLEALNLGPSSPGAPMILLEVLPEQSDLVEQICKFLEADWTAVYSVSGQRWSVTQSAEDFRNSRVTSKADRDVLLLPSHFASAILDELNCQLTLRRIAD